MPCRSSHSVVCRIASLWNQWMYRAVGDDADTDLGDGVETAQRRRRTGNRRQPGEQFAFLDRKPVQGIVAAGSVESPFAEAVADLVGQLLFGDAQPFGRDRFQAAGKIRDHAVEIHAEYELPFDAHAWRKAIRPYVA
jgi:hypothetical protein